MSQPSLSSMPLCSLGLSLMLAGSAVAQVERDPTRVGGTGRVTTTQNGFTLHLVSQFSGLTAQTARNLQRTFFETIALEAELFNPHCPHEISVTVFPDAACEDRDTPGCAYTDQARLEINGQWLVEHPEDYDLMTHEAMHLVQQYPVEADACWYFREGLADVARAWFGVNNERAGWQLQLADDYKAGYTQTADFLIWIADRHGVGVLQALDALQRSGQCPSDVFWREQTGSSIELLWRAYATGFF